MSPANHVHWARMALGRELTQGTSLTPSLAWQLNEVYRQITDAHKLQQTKFRWVLGARGWWGELPILPSLGDTPQAGRASTPDTVWLTVPSRSPQAAAQRREKVS